MDDLKKYIRVGIDYYQEIEIPLTCDNLKTLKKWNKQTIIDDFGRDALKEIKKYISFCVIPSHTDFRRVLNGCYNRYEPLSYSPSKNGNWNNIELFLKHIFGNQYELGLDYLTLLWTKPNQILPILCLVSKEKNTGKTTFLNLLKLIFENNMTINTNEDFRSRFNSDWAGKLIIAIDEVLLDKIEDSERIKNLSTARYYKKESKGMDREEVEFFGKFVLCSNNDENFIKIDNNEIRYWVRNLPVLKSPFNTKLLNEMKNEIPSFAHYLETRILSTKEETRMWFTKEQIYTDALSKLLKGNRTSLENEIDELLTDEFSILGIDELCFTSKNLVEMLKSRNFITTNSHVTSTLKNKYCLTSRNSSYRYYRSDYISESSPQNLHFSNEKGRFFTFRKNDFIEG